MPSARERRAPAHSAANDRKNNPAQFRPRRLLSDSSPIAPAHPDAPASLPSLRADESQQSYKSTCAPQQTVAPHPTFPAPAHSPSPAASSPPPPAPAPASPRDPHQTEGHQHAHANRSVP